MGSRQTGGLVQKRLWTIAASLGTLSAIAIFVGLVFIWGSPDRVAFGSPDESMAQHAIQLIRDTGRPAVAPPFPDPEGIFHQRLWVVADGEAIPTQTPFFFYLHAAFQRIATAGRWMLFLIPSLSIGMLVAAAALLVSRRPWLSLLVPILAFPAILRFLRPWENMTMVVALVSLALLTGVIATKQSDARWLAGSLIATTIAGAVRPDMVHILLAIFLLAATTLFPRRWKLWLASVLTAGITVVGITLLGNQAVTGDALQFPVYLLERQPTGVISGRDLPIPFSFIVSLVLPNGIPDLGLIWTQTVRYWWILGPTWLLTLLAAGSAVALSITLARRRQFLALASTLSIMVLMAILFASRVNPGIWGATVDDPSIGHSLPRYGAIAYLGASVLILAVVGSIRRTALFGLALIPVILLAVLSINHVYSTERYTSLVESVPRISAFEDYAMAVDRDLPENAVIYTRFSDKYVWAVRPTAELPTEPGAQKVSLQTVPLLSSMDRALDVGLRPFVFQIDAEELRALEIGGMQKDMVFRKRLIGEDPDLLRTLIRWSAWEAVRKGSDNDRP